MFTLIIASSLALGFAQVPELTLEDAYRQALSRNLDLQVARARLEQANLLRAKVWTHHMPRIEAIASYAYNSQEISVSTPNGFYLRDVGTTSLNGPAYDSAQPISATNPPGTPSNTIVTPSGYDSLTLLKQHQVSGLGTVTVPLLVPELWPKFREASVAQKLAAETLESARLELLFGVAQIYYGAASLKQAITVQRRILENAREHEQVAGTQVKAGWLPHIALVRAQIDRTRSEQDVLRAENAYAAARSALAALLDRDEDFEVTTPAEPVVPAQLAEAEAMSTQRRADLKVARRQLELSQATVASGYFKYAPSLAATGIMVANNTGMFGTNPFLLSAGVMLRWTLLDGGAREVEIKEHRLKAIEANAALGAATRKARDEVRRATLDLTSARANRVKAQEHLTLARENESIISKNFAAGAASPVEVSDASTALANAEVAVVAESLNSQLAALRLLRATGLFNPLE